MSISLFSTRTSLAISTNIIKVFFVRIYNFAGTRRLSCLVIDMYSVVSRVEHSVDLDQRFTVFSNKINVDSAGQGFITGSK